MPATTADGTSKHIPAWKKLGLKLKAAKSLPIDSPKPIDTPKRKREAEDSTPSKKLRKGSKIPQLSAQSTITPQLARKKSVTFTPETKEDDGDSIKQLFNSWVTDQKAQDPSFKLSASQPAFTIPEPAQVDEQSNPELDEKERRLERVRKPKEKKAKDKPKKISKATESSIIPRRPFLQYLKSFCESRTTWKFNKNHQNHLLKHIFDIEVVPSDHAHFIYPYVRGLQGGVRTRLRDEAIGIKVKDQEDGAAGFGDNMSDERRQQDYDAAMADYISTQMGAEASSKMGVEEQRLLGIQDRHMVKRLAKRQRAEEILHELANSSGDDNCSNDKEAVNGGESEKRAKMNDGSSQKIARKRKQRTVMEADETSSSSDSSSSSESDSDSDTAQNGGVDDTSSSSSSSSSESESGSEATGDSHLDDEDSSSSEGSSEESDVSDESD